MGHLRNVETGRVDALRSNHTVGRSPDADLSLPDRSVSALHALLLHVEGAWAVRDLGSTNGTRVDGVRLPSSVLHPLVQGARLSFGGHGAAFEVVGVAPPSPFGRRADGLVVEGALGRLALGEVVLVQDASGAWAREGAPGVPVLDGSYVEDAGRWRVFLPGRIERTVRSRHLIDFVALFEVSADEEFARLVLEHPAGRVALEPRSFHYHLLVLARARRAAAADGDGGWLDVDEACRMLRCTRNQLNVYVHRARGQLAEHGFVDAEGIVERRARTGALRFGLPSVEERRV